MAPIPLGYVQLQRVVEFYTTHPELRRELADDAGLTRVRALMRTPVWRIERTLRPTPPMRPEPQAPGPSTARRLTAEDPVLLVAPSCGHSGRLAAS